MYLSKAINHLCMKSSIHESYCSPLLVLPDHIQVNGQRHYNNHDPDHSKYIQDALSGPNIQTKLKSYDSNLNACDPTQNHTYILSPLLLCPSLVKNII